MIGFVNLHSHTGYSQLDAINRVKDLFKRAKELGQKAIAITDHGTMAGTWDAYKASKETGVKFIPGNEIYFVEDLSDEKSKRRHLVLLASNHQGFKNLLKITSIGFDNATSVMGRDFPRVDAAILKQYNEGIIATSACGGSVIANSIFNNDMDTAKYHAKILADIFPGRFYIELQPHALSKKDKKTGRLFDQRFLNNKLKELAEELGLPMVATCDTHYLTKKHEKYHDMILAISSKKSLDDLTRHRYATYTTCEKCTGIGYEANGAPCAYCAGSGIGSVIPCSEFYLKSEEEMISFFEKDYNRAFAETLIRNTKNIGDQCEEPSYMEPTIDRLPRFSWHLINQNSDADEFREWLSNKPKMQAILEENAYIRFQVWKTFSVYTKDFTEEKKKEYWDRLLKEIGILEARNFCSYMLIVADFINWAKSNDIDIGPGRGSAGGSLVAFFLGMHEVDSLRYGLYFERFQNRERAEPPDFDCDVSSSGRQRIADYIQNKYGKDYVAYISNINTMTPKVVLKDVARSMNLGGDASTAFKLANEITADIPDKITENDKTIEIRTMDQALKYSPKLSNFLLQYPDLLDYCNNIIGLPKAMSTHAGGICISDIPLADFVPLRTDKDGRVAVAYDKKTCEQVKLVKIDLLGLETLDTLRECYNQAKRIGIELPEPSRIPEGDEKAFRLIHSGLVKGVFQLEGSTIAPMCSLLKPNSIKDIAILSGLGRPGCSKEERTDFIDRRFKKKPITYQHPLLEQILDHTNGIKIFDDDLLKLAQKIAGWDLSKADSLRKLTKLKEKGAALAAQLEKDFISDCMRHSKISREEAEMLWEDVVAPFSKYAFTLAHAVAYSITSYRTAYYKAHAPSSFIAACLNSETQKGGESEDLEAIKKEAKSFGVEIAPCNVNLSAALYKAVDKKTIVMGFLAVDGVGEKAMEALQQNQPYNSFEDFLRKVPSCVNKTVIQSLAKAGAFDSFGISRKYAHDHFDKVREEVRKFVKRTMDDLFSTTIKDSDPLSGFRSSTDALKTEEWSVRDKLIHEKEVLGTYTSGSLDQLFPNFFIKGIYAQSFNKVKLLRDGAQVQLEGLCTGFREFAIKSGKNQGKKCGKITLESLSGETIEFTAWTEAWEKIQPKLSTAQMGLPIRALFSVSEFNGGKSLTLQKIEKIGA